MSNRAFQVRWPLLQAGPTGGSLAFDRAMLKPPGDDSAGPAVESEPLENAIGNVAERIKSQQPAIILETDKTFAAILEIQRELGKLLGALR